MGVFLLLAFVLAMATGCNSDNTADEVNIDLTGEDVEVVLPPGYPATMEGSTLVIQGYETAPMVHSYPAFAGVENPGDLGIGSAAGYDANDIMILPINANLGDYQLGSYKFCIVIDGPQYLQLSGISGSNKLLAQSYPEQYRSASGFEKIPSKTDSPLCLWDSSTTPATGRFNLAELSFKLVDAPPLAGVHLQFQVVELKDPAGNDLCPNFPAGCNALGGSIVSNFRIAN
jgi:hypothetical protein